MAILDVNTLGAVTRTRTGFLSNLVQRENLGGPTGRGVPIYFLFDLKNGDTAAIFVFDPHDNTALAYITKIVIGD